MPVENSTQEEQESYTVAKQIQMKGRQSFILSHIIVQCFRFLILMLLKITSKNFLSRIEGVLCRKLTFFVFTSGLACISPHQ